MKEWFIGEKEDKGLCDALLARSPGRPSGFPTATVGRKPTQVGWKHVKWVPRTHGGGCTARWIEWGAPARLNPVWQTQVEELESRNGARGATGGEQSSKATHLRWWLGANDV